MRILIVDDSVVFRSQIRAALDGNPHLEVVGTANNGRIALQRLAQGSVDLVTLDLEMPEMGGLETLVEIRKLKYPVKVIVFSSHSTRGSEAALEALSKGADDFLAKPSAENLGIGNAAEAIRSELLPKVLQFLSSASTPAAAPPKESAASIPPQNWTRKDLHTFIPQIIVIGSSTGGPPALEKILEGLAPPLRIPILITQHMPPVFTTSLAKRLGGLTGIPCEEGVDGEDLVSNRIYIAPGNYHMTIKRIGVSLKIALDQNPHRNSVRPAVDYLFESAAQLFGAKTMAFVLTGMGEDGLVGAKAIKRVGGGVMIQSKESCVVFGMPGAIFAASVQDAVGDLSQVSEILKRMVQ